MIIFDYIYYRTFSLYKNKWKESMPWLYALTLVTLLQFISILVLFLTLDEALSILMPNQIKVFIGVFISSILILNHFRYRDRIDALSERWESENEKAKRFKGLKV